MKKSKFLLGLCSLFVAGLFAACSESEIKGNEPDEPTKDDGSKVYMTIDISNKTVGSRSQTTDEDEDDVSSDGTEVGQPVENTISEIMILIVGRDNNGNNNCLVAKWPKSFENALSIENGQTLTADIPRQTLINHYDAHKSDPNVSNPANVRVYVICNPDANIKAKIPNVGSGANLNWLDEVISVNDFTRDSNPYWSNNKFLMTNANEFRTQIPTREEIEGNSYNSPNRPFTLTPNDPVLVERAVARLDYAPEIEGSKVKQDGDDYYYVLSEAQEANETQGIKAQPEVRVYLERMSLVNMSKQFYLFRRVSNDGTNKDWVLGGRENTTNWVVDPVWEWKLNVPSKGSNGYLAAMTDKFFYHIEDIDVDGETIINSAWDSYNIETQILKNSKPDGTYHFWRYITPNTMPGVDDQKRGISTGMVFKARIQATDDTYGVGLSMKSGHDIFAFQGKLIGTWQDVRELAKGENNADLTIAFNNAVSTVSTLDKENDEDITADDWASLTDAQTKAVVENGFSRYRQAKAAEGLPAGYYCNYYYWNRHNDNGDNGDMGTMEFAVVRNNIYKLAVTDINRLGHPIDPKNDPDPVDPDDPDEKTELYMVVSVKVVPWTVRKNNITFD